MNFLAHHQTARNHVIDSDSGRPDAPALLPTLLYIGNLLPDLAGSVPGGMPRLRAHHAVGGDPLAQGIRLHLATDRAFHAAAPFATLTKEAGERLRESQFADPPRRVFFVAHLLVEFALDGAVLHRHPDVIDDLYRWFDAADMEDAAGQVQRMLGVETPLAAFAKTLSHFRDGRYLYHYQRSTGLAEGLRRVVRRAGVPGLWGDGDDVILAALCEEFSTRIDGDGLSDIREWGI